MNLTREEISAIAREVVSLLKPSMPEDKVLTMEEAAVILGVKTTNVKSLRVTFTKFANPKKYKNPLKAYYIGRTRNYKMSDLLAFMENRRRN